MDDFWNPNGGEGDNEDGGDDDDDDGEDDVTSMTQTGRDGMIFLIDAHPNMTGNPESFRTCIECIESCLLNTAIASSFDMAGIVFYNTIKSPPPKANLTDSSDLEATKNTAVFIPLMCPSKDMIQYVKNFKESEDFFDFPNRYGSTDDNHFADALWLCSRMFMRFGNKLKTNTLIIFTNTEQPHPNGSPELQKTFVRADDLRQRGVHIILAPTIDDFDPNPFYKEFICMVMDEDPEQWKFIAPAEQRERLLNRVYKHDYRRACQRYFNFNLSNDLAIAVGIYSMKSSTFTPKPIHLLRDTNQLVTSRVCWKGSRVDDDTLEVTSQNLLPGELMKYQCYGGQQLIFTQEELTRMKSLVAPGMRLLGFKPLQTLPERCFIKPCRFLYPNDTAIKGSACLFRALWERCLAKGVYAMCVFCQIRKSAPMYVALVPQQEDPDGNDGFRVVYLPTQTQVRKLDVFNEAVPDVTDDRYELMRKMMKKLRFKYNPKLFENPYLQMFYANIEALVYDQGMQPIEDSTMPDIEYQDSKLDELIDQINQTFGLDATAPQKRTNSSPSTNDKIGGKRAKTNSDGPPSVDDLKQAIADNTISKYTVNVLKAYLVQENVSGVSKLNKTALIDAIKNHLNLSA